MGSLEDPMVLAACGVAGAAAIAYYLFAAKKSGGASAGDAGKQTGISSSGSARLLSARAHSVENIEEINAELKASGKVWKDPDFGHDGFPGPSIGDLELKDGERGKPLVIGSEGVTWQPPSSFCMSKRPLGTRADGVPTWLYSDNDGDGVVSAAESMEASDIAQGSVGDCYFLSALASAVWAHPDLCDDLIDETYEESGIYGVSFWQHGAWQMVWVDSYFPCYRPGKSSHSGKHKLIFSSSTNCKEIWPLVIEKAFAKMHGSYEAIAGGQVVEALEMITGGKGSRIRPSNIGWTTLMEQVQSDDYFVGAGSQQQDMTDVEGQRKRLQGIVTGHAYSILQVYEAGDLRLLELRNPWGRGEWEGDWSDSSKLWDTKEGKAVPSGPKDEDGRFWMSWPHFCECFDTIDVCYFNFSEEERARRIKLREEAERLVAAGKGLKQSVTKSNDDGPERTVESADAMMALLLAEEAADKRKKHVGTDRHKCNGGKRKADKKKKGKK